MAGNILDKQSHRLLSLTNLVKSTRDPRKAFSVLLHRVLAPLGHINYRHFVVLTRDRTGSNMLIQALNSHPNIAAEYEIFANLRGESETNILSRSYGKQPFYIHAKGFKIFYYHPQDSTDSPIWQMLQDMKDLHVVHLKRRNLLRAEISSRLAYTTGIYGVRSDKEFDKFIKLMKPVSFSESTLEERFKHNQVWEKDGASRFSAHPTIDLYYEDMVADFSSEYKRVLDFLGMAFRQPKIDFKKQGARNMRDQVENYEDLKKAFRGTEWEDFFED